LRNAKFDVAVDVGPASATKRQATVRALIGMIQIAPDPETRQVLTSMAMMNMDGEGISDVRAYFRDKLIKMGVLQPTEQEGQKLLAQMQAAQQPDPQAVYLQAAAEEASAKAVKAQADTEYTLARAVETRAKTAETLAGIQQKERTSIVQTAKALREGVANEMRQPPSRMF